MSERLLDCKHIETLITKKKSLSASQSYCPRRLLTESVRPKLNSVFSTLFLFGFPDPICCEQAPIISADGDSPGDKVMAIYHMKTKNTSLSADKRDGKTKSS